MVLIESSPKKIYIRVEAQPVTTAGIYHSPSLWLISLSSDWTNWITIVDKNLWATQVYNDGDILGEANCWKYYQRWNNYGFPFTWAVTTSSTQVNAQNYWPWNYYNSSTFIKRSSSPYNWSSVQNDNLWGNTTDTLVARKWPCDDGYHVATSTEYILVTSILNSIWITTWANTKKYLKMPIAWRRIHTTWDISNQWEYWNYWTSTPGNVNWAYTFTISESLIENGSKQYSSWISIRPFANTPVQPDDSRTVLYPTS